MKIFKFLNFEICFIVTKSVAYSFGLNECEVIKVAVFEKWHNFKHKIQLDATFKTRSRR